MKTCTTLFFTVLFNGLLLAQNATVQSFPEMDNPDPQNFWTQNLGTDETGHYLIRDIGPVSNPQIILEKYDANFKLLFSKDIQSSSGILGDSKTHFETFLGKGELLLFLNSWNKDRSEGGLWASKLSLGAEPVGDEVQLLADKGESMLKTTNYRVAISNDGSKIAVLSEPTFDKTSKESFRLSVFNSADFSKISEKDFSFDIEMERYPKNQIYVNNDGTAYGFKEVKVSGKEFKYYLAVISNEDHFQQEIDLGEDQLNQSKFFIDKNGELVGFGILANVKEYITEWQKTWLVKVNKSEISLNKTEMLGAEMLTPIIGEKKANKEGVALNYFTLKDVIEKPNGGYLFITEELNTSKVALPGQTGTTTIYNHKLVYGGILLMAFTTSGEVEWSTFYDKKQTIQTQNPQLSFGSFAYGIVNNQFQVIWNYTDLDYIISFPWPYWVDKSGTKIAVKDVFGEEARYPTFLTSINMADGSFNYTDRTFSSLPLTNIQQENNFRMAADPSIFFASPKGISILSRMPDEYPKKIKFSRVEFE